MNFKKILIGIGFFVSFLLLIIGGYGLFLSEDWKNLTNENEKTSEKNTSKEAVTDETELRTDSILICTVDTSNSLSLTAKVRAFEFENKKLQKLVYSVTMTGLGEDSSVLIQKNLQAFEGIKKDLLKVPGISIKVGSSENAFLMELNQDYSIVDSETVNSKLTEGQTLDINYNFEEDFNDVKNKTIAAGYTCK